MDPCRFFLRGEMDASTADDVLTRLRRACAGHSCDVVVDCMDLTFISGAGINT